MQNRKNRVLLSGASGFLGHYVYNELKKNSDLELFTIGRKSIDENTILCDFVDETINIADLHLNKVIHVSGKAHSVPINESEKRAFFDVNYRGTLHFLNALNLNTSINQFVLISTVAVYGKYSGELICETCETLADTPYGQSKLEAEKAVIEWCNQRNITYLILRLPLIIGDNPPGNLGSMMANIKKGSYFGIKGNNARKSVVLAEDVARLIAYNDKSCGIYNLTDGSNPTFKDIETAFAYRFSKKNIFEIPSYLIYLIAKFGDIWLKLTRKEFIIDSDKLKKVTSTLTFSSEKAKKELNWMPKNGIEYIKNKIN